MDAILMAGGSPAIDDPLYSYTQGLPKALLDISGKPMIQWVLEALENSQYIERVVITGLEAGSGLRSDKVAAYLPNQGDMLDNIRAGAQKVLEMNPGSGHILLCSSDVPAVQTEAIDWTVTTAMRTDEDVYYNVITRETMEARFPASKRSYVRLQDMDVCGGDVNIARTSKVVGDRGMWDQLIASRKNALKQAALIGYDTLFLLLIRKITLEKAIRKVTKRLNITGRALVCPYAEVGMDVDKPHQLEIVRADLSQRISG